MDFLTFARLLLTIFRMQRHDSISTRTVRSEICRHRRSQQPRFTTNMLNLEDFSIPRPEMEPGLNLWPVTRPDPTQPKSLIRWPVTRRPGSNTNFGCAITAHAQKQLFNQLPVKILTPSRIQHVRFPSISRYTAIFFLEWILFCRQCTGGRPYNKRTNNKRCACISILHQRLSAASQRHNSQTNALYRERKNPELMLLLVTNRPLKTNSLKNI